MAFRSELETALLTALQGVGLSIPIAWPGLVFNPPSDNLYVEPRIIANTPINYSVRSDADLEHRGIFRVLVHGSKGVSGLSLVVYVEQIIPSFAKNTLLTSGSTTVTMIAPPFVGDLVQSDNDVVLPVDFQYVT